MYAYRCVYITHIHTQLKECERGNGERDIRFLLFKQQSIPLIEGRADGRIHHVVGSGGRSRRWAAVFPDHDGCQLDHVSGGVGGDPAPKAIQTDTGKAGPPAVATPFGRAAVARKFDRQGERARERAAGGVAGRRDPGGRPALRRPRDMPEAAWTLPANNLGQKVQGVHQIVRGGVRHHPQREHTAPERLEHLPVRQRAAVRRVGRVRGEDEQERGVEAERGPCL